MPLSRILLWSTLLSLYDSLYVQPFVKRFQNLTRVLLLESSLALIGKWIWPDGFHRIYPLYCFFFIVSSYRLITPYLAKQSRVKYYFVNMTLILQGMRLVFLAAIMPLPILDYLVLIMALIILVKFIGFGFKRRILIGNSLKVFFGNLNRKMKLHLAFYLITYGITFILLS